MLMAGTGYSIHTNANWVFYTYQFNLRKIEKVSIKFFGYPNCQLPTTDRWKEADCPLRKFVDLDFAFSQFRKTPSRL
jgi:hypothetical protein